MGMSVLKKLVKKNVFGGISNDIGWFLTLKKLSIKINNSYYKLCRKFRIKKII